MQNFALLKSLGKCGRPVLLKRGMSSTIKELLMSAEYLVAHGNSNVLLCERGIRTFETATRNTCDIAAVPVLNELSQIGLIQFMFLVGLHLDLTEVYALRRVAGLASLLSIVVPFGGWA